MSVSLSGSSGLSLLLKRRLVSFQLEATHFLVEGYALFCRERPVKSSNFSHLSILKLCDMSMRLSLADDFACSCVV